MNQFKGVFPATITPMQADGRFDEQAFRQVLEYNVAAGVHGFWLAGGTGESVYLDDDENRRIAETRQPKEQTYEEWLQESFEIEKSRF